MDKYIARTVLSLLTVVLGGVTCAFADTPPPPPSNVPPPSNLPSPGAASQMTVSQFQQWLQMTKNAAPGNPPPSSVPPPNNQVSPGNPPPSLGSPPPSLNSMAMPKVASGTNFPPFNAPSPPPRRLHRYHRRSAPLSFEQQQMIMRNSVPARVPENPDAAVAFQALLQQNMPLSPRQVVELHQQIDVSQRAAATPPNIPPKPVSTTLMVNLAPGTTPPAVRLAQGYVSSLVFVDSTGAPWPISAFDIGNPKAVNIQWDGKSNIILIQAVSPYSNGDIVVRLVGLPTPVTLEIVSGQRVVDYRVDIHVSGLGPNTKEIPMGTPLPNSANQLLLGVLDGVPPPGSKLLTVYGADSEAWLLGDMMYLRTRLTVLSPGWVGKMVSPDGMIAYELPRTSSVLVSRYGEPVALKIEGF